MRLVTLLLVSATVAGAQSANEGMAPFGAAPGSASMTILRLSACSVARETRVMPPPAALALNGDVIAEHSLRRLGDFHDKVGGKDGEIGLIYPAD